MLLFFRLPAGYIPSQVWSTAPFRKFHRKGGAGREDYFLPDVEGVSERFVTRTMTRSTENESGEYRVPFLRNFPTKGLFVRDKAINRGCVQG